MAKQPTPQGISALLRKAGFRRSTQGSIQWTEGYQVYKNHGASDTVAVQYQAGAMAGFAAGQARERERFAAYTETIEAAGFTVRQEQTAHHALLIVSANEEVR